MLIAQWVLNTLQLLTLLALIWYTWETRQIGMQAARQYEREWSPQYHFSISGLDPTTGTGRIAGNYLDPVNLTANVINLGRPAIVVRGIVFHPLDHVGTSAPIDPLPLASGQAQHFELSVKPLLMCLKISEQIPTSGQYSWKGKVTLALWCEANGGQYRSPEQLFEMEINDGRLTSVRQMTQLEFEQLSRMPADQGIPGT